MYDLQRVPSNTEAVFIVQLLYLYAIPSLALQKISFAHDIVATSNSVLEIQHKHCVYHWGSQGFLLQIVMLIPKILLQLLLSKCLPYKAIVAAEFSFL